MKTFTPFQIGVMVFFIVLVLLGVLAFTGVIGGSKKTASQTLTGNVVMWGTYPEEAMAKLVQDYDTANQNKGYSVSYTYYSKDDIDSQLAEAIADGTGPDLVVLDQDQIIKDQSKLYHIPYTALSDRTFRDTYAQEGEMFMLSDGTTALPLTINPLILYYNRDLLEAAGLTQPPQTWGDVINDVPLLTKKGQSDTLLQSAIPFGIYGNLNNARDVLSMLFMQAGDPIVSLTGTTYTSVLGDQAPNSQNQISAAESIVNFFTQFTDPTSATYTWNRSFTNARDEFIQGELAMYIGYASELPVIAAQNPNLNFDVAKVPQASATGTAVTFGLVQGIGVIKTSKNISTAIAVASDFTNATIEGNLVTALLSSAPVAPARRDLLATSPQTLFGPTLYNSALIARGWYDPGQSVTDPIFEGMTDAVVSGSSDAATAVDVAHNKLSVLLGQ